MEEKELENQKTFRKYTEGKWYDGYWDYELFFRDYQCIFSLHNEVDGSTRFVKYIKDLADLKRLYEAITNEFFE